MGATSKVTPPRWGCRAVIRDSWERGTGAACWVGGGVPRTPIPCMSA